MGLQDLKEGWNYERPFEDVFGTGPWKPRTGRRKKLPYASDTIGAAATDGRTFAAAGSTGGTIATLLGRVGDTPNVGAGIFAGEHGAVCLTGNGDHLLRERAATMVHRWMGDGLSAQAAVRRLTSTYADETGIWAGVIGLTDHAGGGNREVAWSVMEETK